MTTSPPEPRANPELWGQAAACDRLQRAMTSGRLPHGWLIGGGQGIGKATLGYRFARALLAGRAAVDAGLALAADHPVFRQVAAGSHPDLTVLEVEPAAEGARARAEITVDRVRATTRALRSTAAMGGHRVVLVDGAEQLNRNAANAFLKALEEPPPATVLILISHRPARVPATLRSRCAKLILPRLPDAVVADGLARFAPDLADATRTAVVVLARGSLGRALELAEDAWLELYRRLTNQLAAEPVDRLGLQELALELARQVEARESAAPLAMLQAMLARVVDGALGRLGPLLFAEEHQELTAIGSRRPLERWASAWDEVARLATATQGLSLDRGQVYLHILSTLASPCDRDPAAWNAHLGAPDVVG